MLIDQAPLRTGILAECRRFMRALEDARFEMHQFETGSRPAYDRWMAATFGALLTRRRELGEAISALDDLIHEVHMIAMLHGGSLRSAYRRLMREREAEAARFSAEAQDESDSSEHHGHQPPPDEGGSDEAMRKKIFEGSLRDLLGINPASLTRAEYDRLYRDFCKTFFDAEREEPRRKKTASKARRARENPDTFTQEAPAPPPRSRLKELYRTLVRRLHPDMRADADPGVSALWHEVQEAYSRGDEERLETLLALCDVEANAITTSTSLSQLHAVHADLKRSLNAIRRALRAARKDPAWKFEEKNLERLAEVVRRQLQRQIAGLADELADLEILTEDWKLAAREPTGSPKKKRPRRAAQRDLFDS